MPMFSVMRVFKNINEIIMAKSSYESKNTLIDYIEKYPELFKETKVKSKTVLLKEGEIARKVFIVKKGCLRMWLNHEGKEITFQFFFENEMVASIESLRANKPSMLYIETLEPSTLFVLTKSNFKRLFYEAPELKDFMMEMSFRRFAHYSKLYLSFLKNNPVERYKELLRNEPRIVQRIPQHYIASYLGITPVSLSRIRNKISQ
jgi:CRP-like cAMP-binding protein